MPIFNLPYIMFVCPECRPVPPPKKTTAPSKLIQDNGTFPLT